MNTALLPTSTAAPIWHAENKNTASTRKYPATVLRHHERIEWLDLLRGFMMYFVIYGHITEYDDAIDYIYSFHMPIFFLISGITFRFNRETNSIKFFRKKFCALIIPYLLLSLYAAPLREWLERIGECNMQSAADLLLGTLFSNSNTGYKMASNTLWFIPCLFLTVMIFFFLQKLSVRLTAGIRRIGGRIRAARPLRSIGTRIRKIDRRLAITERMPDRFRADFPDSSGSSDFPERKNRKPFTHLHLDDLVITALVLGLIWGSALLHLDEGSGGIWHYRTAIFATGFYLFGYLLLPYISSLQRQIRRHPAVTVLAALFLFYAGDRLSNRNGFVSMIRNQYHHLPVYYICALATCMAWILIFMMLSRSRIFMKASRFMDFIGKNTLPYIAFQVPVMKLISYYVPPFSHHVEPYVTILSLILYFGLMPVAYWVDKIIPRRITLPKIISENHFVKAHR